MNKQILFIHIPKTAGTSFRLASQEYFGKKDTLYDYGKSSGETSEEILRSIYDENKINLLGDELAKHKRLFLSGHVPVKKYIELFDISNIITFVRNPIDQVVSHYIHYCRDSNYQYDFKTFIKDKKFKNLQSRLLSGYSLESIGFIGLTERYDESISMINTKYGLNLKILKENISSEKGLIEVELDEELTDLIEKENMKDIQMYMKVKKLFNSKVELFEKKSTIMDRCILRVKKYISKEEK